MPRNVVTSGRMPGSDMVRGNRNSLRYDESSNAANNGHIRAYNELSDSIPDSSYDIGADDYEADDIPQLISDFDALEESKSSSNSRAQLCTNCCTYIDANSLPYGRAHWSSDGNSYICTRYCSYQHAYLPP